MARPLKPIQTTGNLSLAQAFGTVLRRRRLANKMLQSELEQDSIVSQTDVSRLERGIRLPDLAMIVHFAVLFGMEPHELVQESMALMRQDT